jgi:type I restriction enzyme M protein
MASSASDAGHSEKDIREKLVKTGAVDVMMAIGNNFFYTRSLPCTLWFFDRGKELLISGTSPQGEGRSDIRTVEHQIPKQLLENARELRKNQTEAEELLWQLLRNRQLNNLKFRRQHPLKAGFILDFYCAESKLGIEIDGGYHNEKEQREYDAERAKIIQEYGIRIIRFTNEQVLKNTEQVLNNIAAAAAPTSSPSGEGLGVRNKNTVLMLDARKIYRKVTSKINDFSPEQLQNLICIVNLYRGNTKKFESTVKGYLETSAELAKETAEATAELQKQLQKVLKTVSDFATKYAKENKEAKAFVDALNIEETTTIYEQQNDLIDFVKTQYGVLPPLQFGEGAGVRCKTLRKPQDKLIKQLLDTISTATKEYQLNKNKEWKELNLKEQLDQLKALQQQLSGNPDEEEPGLLHQTEYFYKQAHWLTSRFPDGVYTDVAGLCKVVTQKEIESKDWSLSPGRYVGVDTTPEKDIDYEERLNEIHIELEGLNEEAMALAKTISENFKMLQ